MYLYIFFELGGAALALEDAWLSVAICRSKIMKEVHGGVAQLVGKILALMLPEFSTTGLSLSSGAGSMRLFARLSTVVQDPTCVSLC